MPKDNKMLTKNILAISDSRYQLKKFQLGLKEEFKPEGFYQDLLVDKLTADYLRLKKALLYEKDHIYKSSQVDNSSCNNEISQFVSYVKSIEKSIENGIKAIKEAKDRKPFANLF